MPLRPTLATFPALAGTPPDANFPQLDFRGGVSVLAFDAATAESVDFFGVLPASYSGKNFEITLHWIAATSTSGDVVWQIAFERHAIDDFDFDVSDFGSPVSATDTVPDAAGKVVRTSLVLPVTTAGNPAASESFRLRLTRVASDAADTMSGDAQLLALTITEE